MILLLLTFSDTDVHLQSYTEYFCQTEKQKIDAK